MPPDLTVCRGCCRTPQARLELEGQSKPCVYLGHFEVIDRTDPLAQVALVQGHNLAHVYDRISVQTCVAGRQSNIARRSGKPEV